MVTLISIFRVGLPEGSTVLGSTTKEAAIAYARKHLANPANPVVNEQAYLGEYIFSASSVVSDGQTGLTAPLDELMRKKEHGLVVWNIENS